MGRLPVPPTTPTRPLAAACLTASVVAALAAVPGTTPARAVGPAAAPAGAEATELRLSVGERALLECLRAATPETVTVGSGPLSADLTLLDPSEVSLRDGRASFKIRVKGRTLPVDQVVNPVVTLARDPRSGQYSAVVSSLPVAIQGLGSIDLKDYLPRFDVPAILENLWQMPDRPLGLRLRIRRIAILDHLLEVGADIEFAPLAGSRPGERP